MLSYYLMVRREMLAGGLSPADWDWPTSRWRAQLGKLESFLSNGPHSPLSAPDYQHEKLPVISQCNRVFQFSDHDQLTGEDRPVMRDRSSWVLTARPGNSRREMNGEEIWILGGERIFYRKFYFVVVLLLCLVIVSVWVKSCIGTIFINQFEMDKIPARQNSMACDEWSIKNPDLSGERLKSCG